MTVLQCLNHCVHWSRGRCRLEYPQVRALESPDCLYFDQRVAAQRKTNLPAGLGHRDS